ncbi:MAG TPA: tryptophan synthase subunit alpha, partial [Candidatus Dormibacteraeota bacterium]
MKVVPYLMAGFPNPERCLEDGRRFAAAGAAALELGIPFSDPLADGPVIQAAGQAALANGITCGAALEIAGRLAADTGLPLILMTYTNTILAAGPREFARQAAAQGVAGVIVPDLPPEESAHICDPLRTAD